MGVIRRYHPPGRLSAEALLVATGARQVAGPGGGDWSLCTDSREMVDGGVFVALSGENFDGHRFLDDVLRTHRGGAIIQALPEDPSIFDRARGPVLLVDDTLVALGAAASSFFGVDPKRVVAVTGSVGKTTTRAMIAAILSQKGPGLQTEGNFNNRIGLPLTLLRARPEDGWAVLEMGMSEPGEIRTLAAMVRPAVRVITEVAAAHLEFFPDVEAIADAKGELFEAAVPGDTLVYPAENPLSARFPRPEGTREVAFSLRPEANCPVKALEVDDRGPDGLGVRMRWLDDELSFHLPLPGRHQVHNALAAAAAAWALGASAEDIVAGLCTVEVPGRRMRVLEVAGVTVVDDAYNANPASVRAALDTLAAFASVGRRVAALGDMLELGSEGPRLHAEVGTHAASLGIDLVVGTGPLMTYAVEAAEAAGTAAVCASDSEEAGRLLAEQLQPGDLLLLKGSRGIRMERALDLLSNEREG